MEPSRGDGHEQTRDRSNESFAYSFKDHHLAEPLSPDATPEGAQETHNCAKKADEWRGCGNRGKSGKTAFHFEAVCAGSALQAAFDGPKNLCFGVHHGKKLRLLNYQGFRHETPLTAKWFPGQIIAQEASGS